LPLEENIKISKQVKNYARKKGVLMEGEVGRIGSDSSKVYTEKFEIKEEDLTKPEEAEDYIKKTKADLLAISVGTFHGVDITGMSPHIRLERLKEIKNATNSASLVLHGGSGTPDDDIMKAIKLGVVKININTELRIAFAENLRKAINAGEIVPYKFLAEAINAVESIAECKIRLFNSEGKV
jgi:fructose-bisphosphate aldolase class II